MLVINNWQRVRVLFGWLIPFLMMFVRSAELAAVPWGSLFMLDRHDLQLPLDTTAKFHQERISHAEEAHNRVFW
jgi:hypothetical protein